MRLTLLVLNASLVVIFAAGFAMLVLAPASVERRAHGELVQRIAFTAAERYPQLMSQSWTHALIAVLQGDTVAAREKMVSPELDVAAAVFANLCRYRCGSADALASRFRESLSGRLRNLDAATRRVENWARGRYHELIDELIADLKIFTATNTVLSALAFLLARTQAHRRTTLVSSAILAGTVASGAWLYLFEQTWLQTVLFADYVGYAYLIWVFLIAAVLFDAVFNQGRGFRIVLNAVASGLGG